jgi:hypothetical protein
MKFKVGDWVICRPYLRDDVSNKLFSSMKSQVIGYDTVISGGRYYKVRTYRHDTNPIDASDDDIYVKSFSTPESTLEIDKQTEREIKLSKLLS